jgi:CheY-like chemotaxis protein
MFRVLLVSKESVVLAMAESSSWELQTAANGWDAMERVQSDEIPHLLVLDMPRGDADSLQLLSWLRRLRPDLSVVVLCHAEDAGSHSTGRKRCAGPALRRKAIHAAD